MTELAQPSAQDQDLSTIRSGDWPVRQFPLGQREHPTRRQVIFKQSVLNDIYAHGLSAPEVEVCGVLVGNVYRDHLGAFVFIEANIRGNFSAGKAAQVTFTAQTWTHIQEVMDHSYPDLRIMGWYHTHPGHGIFLSDMDLFIHQNFFSLPWHIAFVYDPQHQEEGLFAWRNGNLNIESFVVQKDAFPLTRVARRVPELRMRRGGAPIAEAPPIAQPAPEWDHPVPPPGMMPPGMPPLVEIGADEMSSVAPPEPIMPPVTDSFSSAPLASPRLVALTGMSQALMGNDEEALLDDDALLDDESNVELATPPINQIRAPATEVRSEPEARSALERYSEPEAQSAPAPSSSHAPPAPLVNLTRPPVASAEVLDLSLRIQTLERRQRWMTAITALAILIAVAWPLALAAFALLHSPPAKNTDWPVPGINARQSAPRDPSPAHAPTRTSDNPREAAAH